MLYVVLVSELCKTPPVTSTFIISSSMQKVWGAVSQMVDYSMHKEAEIILRAALGLEGD